MLYGNKTGTFLKDKKDKSFITNYLSFYLVPRPGVEPGWMLLHWCLRPARLPIPPSGLLDGAKVDILFDCGKLFRLFFQKKDIYRFVKKNISYFSKRYKYKIYFGIESDK